MFTACTTALDADLAMTLLTRARKSLQTDPVWLARSQEGLPKRIIDYVVALKPDATTRQAYRTLPPLKDTLVKSWNHVTRHSRLCTAPIALNIETKAPNKSWTDGKPQIALWTDAWLRRLSLLPGARDNLGKPWPAIPLLIAQGHDWYLIIIQREGDKTVFRDKIDIGSTRSCFDALKVLAVLHWCMDWAETVWRPWFLSLIQAG